MRLYRVDLLDSTDKCIISNVDSTIELDTFDKAMSLCKKRQNSKKPINVGDHYVVVHLESGEVVFGSIERRKYRVDFWDSFDHWIASGLPIGFDPESEFEDLDKAIELCKEKQIDTPPNNMGEHYGVIDLDSQREVFCGKNWFKATDEKKRIKVTVDDIFDMNVNQLLTGIVFEICNMPVTGNKEIYERHAKIVTMIARIRQQLGFPLDIEEIKIK